MVTLDRALKPFRVNPYRPKDVRIPIHKAGAKGGVVGVLPPLPPMGPLEELTDIVEKTR